MNASIALDEVIKMVTKSGEGTEDAASRQLCSEARFAATARDLSQPRGVPIVLLPFRVSEV